MAVDPTLALDTWFPQQIIIAAHELLMSHSWASSSWVAHECSPVACGSGVLICGSWAAHGQLMSISLVWHKCEGRVMEVMWELGVKSGRTIGNIPSKCYYGAFKWMMKCTKHGQGSVCVCVFATPCVKSIMLPLSRPWIWQNAWDNRDICMIYIYIYIILYIYIYISIACIHMPLWYGVISTIVQLDVKGSDWDLAM